MRSWFNKLTLHLSLKSVCPRYKSRKIYHLKDTLVLTSKEKKGAKGLKIKRCALWLDAMRVFLKGDEPRRVSFRWVFVVNSCGCALQRQKHESRRKWNENVVDRTRNDKEFKVLVLLFVFALKNHNHCWRASLTSSKRYAKNLIHSVEITEIFSHTFFKKKFRESNVFTKKVAI